MTTEYMKESWTVDTFDSYYILDSSGLAIAQIMGNEHSNRPTLRARARLIAAAPTMYEFIAGIAAGDCHLDDPCYDAMEARAIIAEIKGKR